MSWGSSARCRCHDLKEDRDDENRDDVHDLDHRIDRGAGGVFVRIADGVARYRGGVGEGTFRTAPPFDYARLPMKSRHQRPKRKSFHFCQKKTNNRLLLTESSKTSPASVLPNQTLNVRFPDSSCRAGLYGQTRCFITRFSSLAAIGATMFFGLALSRLVIGQVLTQYSWTDATTTNTWENPGNWSPALVPDGDNAQVQIAITAPCTLQSWKKVHDLALSTGAQLIVEPGSILDFTQSASVHLLTNNGTISIITDQNSPFASIYVRSDADVEGNGVIAIGGEVFNPPHQSGASINVFGGTLTIGKSHTLSGSGNLNLPNAGVALVNNGLIVGNIPQQTLRISQTESNYLYNNGLISGANGGGVLFSDLGTVDQTGGGSIVAQDGSLAELGVDYSSIGPIFHGGTFETAGSGIVRASSASFDGCTNTGSMELACSHYSSAIRLLAGGLTNNGTIVADVNVAGGSPSYIQVSADSTLGGTGDFKIVDVQFNLAGVTLTHGAHHLLHGRGRIDLDKAAALINQGTILADDSVSDLSIGAGKQKSNTGLLQASDAATLSVTAPLDQTGGGTIMADGAGSHIAMSGDGSSPGSVINGGSLRTQNGGQISADGVILTSCYSAADLHVPAGRSATVAGAGITNDGTVAIEDSGSLTFANPGAIAGAGTMLLKSINGAPTTLAIAAGATVTNTDSHTIGGRGQVSIAPNASLINNGTIAPGTPIGQLRFSGDLRLGDSAQTACEIKGITPVAEYDNIDKTDYDASGNPVPTIPLTLNGTLAVTLRNRFVPSAGDTFAVITTAAPLRGAFRNVASGGRLSTTDGTGSFVVTYDGKNVILSSFLASGATPAPAAAAQSQNISTRLNVLTDDNVMIGGFIVTGNVPKKVILRGIGPSVPVNGALADPTLELHLPGGSVLTNDNWKTNDGTGQSQEDEVRATAIPPQDDPESALVVILPPGAYTAIVRGKDGGTGIGLVEVYDLDAAADAKLANISTRGFVDTGNNVMIGGFILGPKDSTNTKVAVRALGPSLPVNGTLQDPALELHDGNGALTATNDNWQDDPSAGEIQADKLNPTDPRESALIRTLAPGAYTVIIRGAGDSRGVGLVEVYNLQ